MVTATVEKYILAHDLGTSALKSSLVDSRGRIVRSRTEAYPTNRRFVGYAEQEPSDWWKAFCGNCAALTKDIPTGQLAGIILTGQMMCCLPLDKTGAVLHPAIIWSDSRAEAQWRQLESALGTDHLFRTTGIRGSAYYSLPKFMWLAQEKRALFERTHVFLSPKDYINFRLTGSFASDCENAAYMYCFDRAAARWSREILQAAGIPEEKLPELVPAGTLLGGVLPEAAEDCALPAGMPVIMGPGDGGAATLGSGVLEPGDAYTSLGTSSWVCVAAEANACSPAAESGISTLTFFDKLRFSGTMQAGGYAFSWFKDTFFPGNGSPDGDVFSRLNALAAQSPPGANGCLFQPYLSGERAPLWDSRMRAAFLGMTASTVPGDLCRSVQEGVSLHLKWILDQIRTAPGAAPVRAMKLIGGGAKSELWQQIFADIYGMPILTVKNPGQAAALGLSVVAGATLGMFSDYSVIREFQPVEKTVLPDRERQEFYAKLADVYLYSVRCTQELNHRLAALMLP